MIKISRLDEILKSVSYPEREEVLQSSARIFQNALQSQNSVKTYVEDFIQMDLPSTVFQSYYKEGLSVLTPAINSKKKLNIAMVNDAYVIYNGLLNKEFVVGFDTTKGWKTSIYTKSENLLELLHKEGAFDNEDKYLKNMKALFGDGQQEFGNKIVSSFEKFSIAMGRIDISAVIGDEVSLELVIPSKFRTDYGTTFKMYPYIIFPYLSESLVNFVNSFKERTFTERGKKVSDVRAVTIMQNEESDKDDGSVNVKMRRVAFSSQEVLKAYRKGKYRDMDEVEEAQNLLKNQILKTKIGWDCLKLYMKGYNLEASLYDVFYTGIRFERIINIMPCFLKDIDVHSYMVDYDDVRRLFRARVNNWKLNDFVAFERMVNTNSCANISERIKMINSWAYNVDNQTLYRIMLQNSDLFVGKDSNGNDVDIDAGLDEMYRNKPKASKNLVFKNLPDSEQERIDFVKGLLKKGVCRIEASSTRTGAPRSYLATNNQKVLNASYGENKLAAFESPKRSLENLISLIESGHVNSFNNFLYKMQNAEVDGLVDYSQLDENSSKAEWISVLKDARKALDDNTKGTLGADKNPFIVNFRRINADSREEFYGAVDVRNITSIEFGEQK